MNTQIQNPAFQKHFFQYEQYIEYKRFKAKIYKAPVKEFLIWLEKIGISQIKDVTSKESKNYYEYLIERPNKKKAGTLAGSTIKSHLFALSLFLDNLLKLGEIKKGFVIQKFKANDKKEREVLTIDEIKLLYKHTENMAEQAILSVGYGCGLRRSEMQNLDLSDIQLSRGMLIVRKGKGDKRREVPISDTVLHSLNQYISECRLPTLSIQSETAFFLNSKGKRAKGETLNKALKKLIKRTNDQNLINKEITLHCLRHSIAHHLMEKNAGIDFIRDFLGHKFSNTASLYAKKQRDKLKIIKTFAQ